MKNPENLITVKNLVKTYKTGTTEVPALSDVSLTIDKGEFLAIMGASGSGKSTFMNILGCLDNPTAGTYTMEGIDVLGRSRDELAELRNRKLGFVFQSFNILPRTSALENVELPLLYNNTISPKDYGDKALDALKSVGLGDRVNAMPNELSGGQQQRVAIARSLVNDPIVIMADEPTGNLDSRTSYEIMQIFQKLNDAGITIVMVTHEPDIAQFAKTNIVFKDGKIIANEAVKERKNATEELKLIAQLSEEKSTT
ncbi:ABC transporter ATP-binding protein [Runella sp.]|jgi:putative ABC transport system ATP-binding protein|uniref:ABC transporter ATP-binding protein n=1 Tax=Runella sp. TaxID=1960881 RepID=UPI0026323318|nr:ABC transporter ATP-binding protein [Runella sp.]